MIKFLDLHWQYVSIKDEIDAAMAGVIRESTFVGGAPVRQFEQAFLTYQQAQHCVGVGNGTDAIEIALEALRLPHESEVIVPANSFIASSEAVTRAGLRVVFADVDDTYTLDLADAERRITPNTSAVLAVHLYGQPADMSEILLLAKRHDLRVLEDAAQAHGAEIDGHRVGALGDAGTFSFYPGKNLGAFGDAGALVTNDDDLAQRARMLANHGRLDKYRHEFEGRNSRLDGMQAAVLEVKLRHLDAWIARRNEIADRYLAGLAEVGDVVLPAIRTGVRHSFHLFVIRTSARDGLAEHLRDVGVQTGVHYPISLPQQPAYAYLGQQGENMRASSMGDELMSLPIGEHLSDDDVDRVIEQVRAFYG